MIRHALRLVCLLLAACTPLDEPAVHEIALTVLDSGVHCGGLTADAGAQWIDRPQNFSKRLQIPERTRSHAWDPAVEGLLWIDMGSRPTGGYSIELAAPSAQVRATVATVQVFWREPAQDSFVTQALTSPCLLLKVPKSGIRKIIVKDQNGRARFQITVPNV